MRTRNYQQFEEGTGKLIAEGTITLVDEIEVGQPKIELPKLINILIEKGILTLEDLAAS